MFKNVASQLLIVYAYDTAAETPKTGDASNITAYLSKDGGAAVQTNDVNPTELDSADMKGLYTFTLTQEESNADIVICSPVSSTTNVILEPVIIYTVTTMRGTDDGATAAQVTAIDSRIPDALVSGRMNSNMDAVKDNATAATNLAQGAEAVVLGAAVGGTLSMTQATTDLTEDTNDHYTGRIIIWTSGTLKGQGGSITAYTGATKLLQFSSLTEAPLAGDTFVIF